MHCRECGSKNTRVTCTQHLGNQTKRYCRCEDCQARFRTIETYQKPKPGPAKGSPRRGIIAKGSKHGSSIFTDQDILNIRRMYREGNTYKTIAEKYGIGSSYVSKIVNRKQWAHLP